MQLSRGAATAGGDWKDCPDVGRTSSSGAMIEDDRELLSPLRG